MIKDLTHEEAKRLRELVMRRFRQSPFTGAGIRITQHKNNYRPLVDDIIRRVEGAEASVTTYRLRKLFYYNDPEICAADKLESPSFGDDFIRMLFKYIGEESTSVPILPKPRKFPRKWFRQGIALLLLLAGSVSAWQWLRPSKYWEENFEEVSAEGLKSRGFEFLDYDPVAFSRQLMPGHLTLYTYPGDYWVKRESGENPLIKNMILKALGGKDCLISTSVNHFFDPKQNHQQAGLFLFGEDKDPNNSIRVCYTFEKTKIKTMVFGNQPTDTRQSIQIIQMHNGQAFAYPGQPLRFPEFQPEALSEVGMIIRIRGKTINLSCWEGFPWSPVHPVNVGEDIELPFLPKYVGIAAFQGLTDEFGRLNSADTIPAFFDYLKVESLPE